MDSAAEANASPSLPDRCITLCCREESNLFQSPCSSSLGRMARGFGRASSVVPLLSLIVVKEPEAVLVMLSSVLLVVLLRIRALSRTPKLDKRPTISVGPTSSRELPVSAPLANSKASTLTSAARGIGALFGLEVPDANDSAESFAFAPVSGSFVVAAASLSGCWFQRSNAPTQSGSLSSPSLLSLLLLLLLSCFPGSLNRSSRRSPLLLTLPFSFRC
mmetsp:Transcript_36476/g.79794  ORF Transcript_36476/g.79794 Transcript_36476/m.79794 type:complete len:218 (-) Transcript_36476:472-1125(-)